MHTNIYIYTGEFLTQSIHNKVVPKGLTAHVQLNIPGKPSERLKRRVQGIMKKASLDTMALLLGRYQGLPRDLKNSVAQMRDHIERETDTEVALKINSRVERKVHREEIHLLAKREKKLKALCVKQTSSSLSNTALESRKKRNRRFRQQKGKKNTEKHKDDKLVVNLFSVELSESESSLLSKGLGFCPRPKSYDRGKLVEDNNAFSRCLCMKSHFHSFLDRRTPQIYPEFIEKNDWQPPKQSRNLETLISSVEYDIAKHKPQHRNMTTSNLLNAVPCTVSKREKTL